jgi:hypothetical protein
MKLFSIFGRQAPAGPRSGPEWRRRETALIWAAPLVLFSALAIAPVTLSLLIDPAFPGARLLGCALVPVIAFCQMWGNSRLAFCLLGEFDLLSLIAGGVIATLVVIAMCSGVLLAAILPT